MKDYKLLLAGLILLLILCIAIFTWLWINNRKNINPLPITADENEPKVIAEGDNENVVSDITLHIQAEESLQEALNDIIVRFESRYPHIHVDANYVPVRALLTLPDNANEDKDSDFVVGIDIIIANNSLSTERLAPLQAELKAAQDKINQNKTLASQTVENDTVKNDQATTNDEEAELAKTARTEARTLSSYNYALKDDQTLEGVILTENTAAINFRNFLLSSAGQDILREYGYRNIEGYKNNVDDLFNPTLPSNNSSNEPSVDVADALSNGKS